MFCAISGEAAVEPVASKKSGAVFEKRLIEAYIAEHGKDPTNSEDMSLDDLVALKDSSLVLPRAPDMASSIPQLMKALQTEWETKMVSSFDQIQEVRRLREELAQTKWSYLAAAQTVRRVRIERDEARAALMQVSVGSGKGPAASVSAEDEVKPPIGTVLPAHLFQKVQDTQSILSAGRRKRSVPDDYATVDRVKKVKPAKPSSPLVSAGSTAFAITNSGHVVLAGSLDGGASVYSIRKQKSMYEFSTGKIGVSSVANIDYEEEESNNAALFGLENGIIKMYHGETPVTTIKGHTGPVASLAVHPSHDIAASVGEDQRVVMYDLKNGKGIEKIKDMTISTTLNVCEFHPDGHFVAVGGEDGKVTMYSTDEMELQATFEVGGPVKDIAFSENGTWVAIALRGSKEIQIWDLRKGHLLQTLAFASAVRSIEFDWSGQYIASATSSAVQVQHYDKAGKAWNKQPISTHDVGAMDAKWAPQAKGLIVLKDDGTLCLMNDDEVSA